MTFPQVPATAHAALWQLVCSISAHVISRMTARRIRAQGRPILLIEDDHDTRLLISLVLSHAGHRVITAQDGQQALEILGRGITPKAMIVDLILPRVGGAHVLRHVADNSSLIGVRTIAVSGDEDGLDRAHADASFLKPVDPYALVRSIDELLQSSRTKS